MTRTEEYEILEKEVEGLRNIKNISKYLYNIRSKELKEFKEWIIEKHDDPQNHKFQDCNTYKEAVYLYIDFYSGGIPFTPNMVYEIMKQHNYVIGGNTPLNTINSRVTDIYKSGYLTRNKIKGRYHYSKIV